MRWLPKQRKHLYILVFLLISLVVMWDLLKPGYIFALDMAFGPNYPRVLLNDYVYGLSSNLGTVGASCIIKVFYSWMTYLLSLGIPVWLIQKFMLIVFLTLSAVGMYRLVPTENRYGRYFAGILYIINPFIYVRYLSGSFFTIWGYALLPFVVKSFIDLVQKPSIKNAIRSGILLTLIAPSDHFLTMALGVFLIFLIFNLFRRETRAKVAKGFLLVIGIFFVLNGNWMVSLMSGKAEAIYAITEVTTRHFELFATIRDSNVFINVATLYGFWLDDYYYYPKEHFLGWYFMFSSILLAAIYGFIVGFRGKHGLHVMAVGAIAIISLVLAVGISSPYTSQLTYFLFENLMPFRGFRETHKFAALLVLAYAYLGSIGISKFEGNFTGKIPRMAFAVVIFMIPLAYTYSMFFGFWGQLNSVDYPEDYYQVNTYFEEDKDNSNILFLPWHGFMTFSWVDSNVGNPARNFFTKPVVQGDNIEMGDVYSTSQNPVSKYIESLLHNGQEISNFGEFVAPIDVKYIVLAKEEDYTNYAFLFEQADLAVLMDTNNLFVFENESWGAFHDLGRQAQLLGLGETEIQKLEYAISRYRLQRDSRSNIPGYIASGFIFISLIGYLAWDRRKISTAGKPSPTCKGKD